jgi:glycosyltransferase involved in cell wall biosynthesis
MNIVVAHNFYRIPGGEDQVFEDEVQLLTSHGHNVVPFTRHNHDFSGLQTIAVAAGTVWNRPAAEALEELARDFNADIVHFHNWLPQISQAAIRSARRSGAAVVQTIHNYRYTCAAGVLFRDNDICEECVGKTIGWPAIKHGCYRHSRVASVPVVAALATHKILGTTKNHLDAAIVLSDFARQKLSESGLPLDRMYIKSNFVDPDPGLRNGSGGYFVHLGRLETDKGTSTLLRAWSLLEDPPPLKIAGSGHLEAEVAAVAARSRAIEFLGQVAHGEVLDLLGEALAVIVPSQNYEGFPKIIAESFAVGTPVIASDLGSVAEIVEDGTTGFLFPPGDAQALADCVRSSMADNGLSALRSRVRAKFVNEYGADANYRRLMEIYSAAIEWRNTTG